MALDSYSGLSASLQTWGERTYSQAQIDEFISMAEAAFNRRLLGYQREVTATLTMDADGDVALPTGFLGIRSVYDASDVPHRYSISGSSLNVIDGESEAFTVTYFARLTPLTSTETSNWLLAAAPDAYLFMCRALQCAFEEDPRAEVFEARALGIIDELTMQNTVAQYGRAGVTMRVAP